MKRKNAAKLGANKFDTTKEVKAIARERVGPVKPGKTIQPKDLRKKPKHKKAPADDQE